LRAAGRPTQPPQKVASLTVGLDDQKCADTYI
jgi:hypothetical protein